MSLQDDYFDLCETLTGEELKAFERIWFAFCDLETQQMVRNGELSSKEYFEWFEEQSRLVYASI